jgi:hypothetical protein
MKLKDLHGTYVALVSTRHRYHITLCSSIKQVDPAIVSSVLNNFQLPICVRMGKSAVFDLFDEKGVLSKTHGHHVVQCDDPRLMRIHRELINSGLEHSHETYNPHVTIGEIELDDEPAQPALFELTFDQFIIEPIRQTTR